MAKNRGTPPSQPGRVVHSWEPQPRGLDIKAGTSREWLVLLGVLLVVAVVLVVASQPAEPQQHSQAAEVPVAVVVLGAVLGVLGVCLVLHPCVLDVC